MVALIRFAQIVLLLLAVFGFYSTWYLIYNNGTIHLMEQIRDYGPHILPGTEASLKRKYTGIGRVDYQLTVLVLFFWEQVDGSMPNGSLFCFMFAGQAVAAWSLIYIEGRRLSNRWRLISFATCWGLAIQAGTFAVFMPLHLAIHLSTSPSVSSRRSEDFAVKTSRLLSIPFSLALGFFIPAVMLALPAPSILTYDQKQNWIAAWQVFPLWVEISQEIIAFLIATIRGSVPNSSQNRQSRDKQTINALRTVYTSVLIVAGVTRIATFSLSLTSKAFPLIFAPEFRGIFNPSTVLKPASLLPSKKMGFVGEGAFQLLQYDEMCGSTALLIWSAALLANKYAETRPIYLWTVVRLFVSSAVLVTLFGLSGCAVALTWARDELVFEEKGSADKKSN